MVVRNLNIKMYDNTWATIDGDNFLNVVQRIIIDIKDNNNITIPNLDLLMSTLLWQVRNRIYADIFKQHQ
jgi:hypothetical protein